MKRLSDAELDEIVRPNMALESSITGALDEYQETIGALERRGLTKGEAAQFLVLDAILTKLDEIREILEDRSL